MNRISQSNSIGELARMGRLSGELRQDRSDGANEGGLMQKRIMQRKLQQLMMLRSADAAVESRKTSGPEATGGTGQAPATGFEEIREAIKAVMAEMQEAVTAAIQNGDGADAVQAILQQGMEKIQELVDQLVGSVTQSSDAAEGESEEG